MPNAKYQFQMPIMKRRSKAPCLLHEIEQKLVNRATGAREATCKAMRKARWHVKAVEGFLGPRKAYVSQVALIIAMLYIQLVFTSADLAQLRPCVLISPAFCYS